MKCKMIYQHDERDCGAASLAMILSYYGLYLPMAKCREITHTDHKGTNIYGLIEGAGQMGMKAEGMTGTLEELTIGIRTGEIKLPFIAHVVKDNMQGHFVVVTKLHGNRIHILDPGKGRRKISLNAFAKKWTGNIVVFSKTDDFVPADLAKGTILKFFCLLKGQFGKLSVVFLLSLLLSVLGVFSAFVFQTIVDEFGVTVGYYEVVDECEDENCTDEEHHHEEDSENLFEKLITYIDEEAHNYNVFFVVVILMYLVQGVIHFARTFLMTKIAQKIDISLSMDYYSKLVQLPMKTVNQRKTGEYLSRFADASIIRDTVSEVCITVILDFLLAFAYGIMLYMQNAKMFLVAICVMLLYFVIVLIYRKPLDRMNRDVMESSAQVEAYIKEVLDGTETVKITKQEERVIEKGRKKYIDVTKKAFREGMLSGSQNILSDLIEMIGNIIIIWIGFGLVLEETITVGALISFFIVLGYFTSPVKNLMQLQPTIQTAVIAAERLNDILELSAEKDGIVKNVPQNWNEIRFKNVWFQYDNQDSILQGIDLCIHRGERIAIVGANGSGKSTLVKLLVRLYDANDGEILIQNENINKFSYEDVREMITYVNQNAYFFSDSIRNNLMAEKEEISEQQLETICKECVADEMIQAFPFQYDMALTEMGQNISSGQRQRLAIARALLQEPQVLILDEATSNLDFSTEQQIKNNLFAEKELTIVMISHKLSTVTDYDRIIVMENGKVVESGKHQELLERKGTYYRMWERNYC